MRLITQLFKHPKTINPFKDLAAGIIVALVSIPISMGYAGIAGLPVVYGLYGSLIPIFIFALLSTSPQFVVGVDAMPAVMVGTLLSTLGIAGESEEALKIVPLISLLVAMWFAIFYLIKAGRVVKYISTPVMGGFISGVGLTIILMQVPKLFGGNPGTGEIIALGKHIYDELPNFNWMAAILGFGTAAIILVCKKFIPKVPMTVIMMGVGAALEYYFHLEDYGVKMLPEVSAGLPKLVIPGFNYLLTDGGQLLLQSLSIAAVIMCQTLLATGNYAHKYGDKIDNNKELLAYAAMNVAGAGVGCCPINGSVSRSGIADSFGARSQLMSVFAALTMLAVLLWGTPFLKYLPVPVLTGIVMTALIGILEIKLSKRLWKTSKVEWLIFIISFLAVLLFGTVYGVIIGCVLSFAEVAMRATKPTTAFVGRIPGQGNFYPMSRNSAARPIEHVVIYRFRGNLFFANVDLMQDEIEKAIKPDTLVVILDARAISTIDITAADRLVGFYNILKKKGIRLYIAEHDGSLNDQFRTLGARVLLDEGAVRRTITLALQDVGIEKPYKLEDLDVSIINEKPSDFENEQALAELEWVFGDETEAQIQKMAEEAVASIEETPELLDNTHISTRWGHLSAYDEDEFLENLELRIEEMVRDGKIDLNRAAKLENHIEERRRRAEARLSELDPKAAERLHHHMESIHDKMQKRHPKEYEHLQKLQAKLKEQMDAQK